MKILSRKSSAAKSCSKAPIRKIPAPALKVSSVSALPSGGIVIQRKPLCACGGGCPRCKAESSIQPKLRVNPPNDKHEQQADRVADQIMRMPDSEIQRKPT